LKGSDDLLWEGKLFPKQEVAVVTALGAVHTIFEANDAGAKHTCNQPKELDIVE
jgi:hypothetical protein